MSLSSLISSVFVHDNPRLHLQIAEHFRPTLAYSQRLLQPELQSHDARLSNMLEIGS